MPIDADAEVIDVGTGAWRAGAPSGTATLAAAVEQRRRRPRGRGDGGACARCAAEAARTFVVEDPARRPAVTSPEAAADLLVPELHDRDRERCVAACLDTKHRLLRVATVSVGSVDHTFMAPREVFRDALLANATALVLAHNHPSGDAEPSRDDELITRRLVRAGEVVGIEVLDHLVVGGTRWVSLARRGAV